MSNYPSFGHPLFLGWFSGDSAAENFISNNTTYIDGNGYPQPGLMYYDLLSNSVRVIRGIGSDGVWSSLTGDVSVVENVLSTSNYLQTYESGKIIHNKDTLVTLNNYLPNPLVLGVNFTFMCAKNGSIIRAYATGGTTITVGNTYFQADDTTGVNGYVQAGDLGSVIKLAAISSTEWYATSVIGDWVIV